MLGHTGNFNGGDIIDIVCQQPATARIVARHLYNFFVADEPQVPSWSVTPPRDPEAIDALARSFTESNYSKKDPVLVVLQLSGGNDYLNTVIPYADPSYRDNRPVVGIPEKDVLALNDEIGLHPSMGPIRQLYRQGNVAIIHGVGYPNSPRSHFRSMDIWHTCEPEKMGTEGWLGLATRDLDPRKENVVTTVSFGPSMFRAVAVPGVPVACVDNLESYGLLTGISGEDQRQKILSRFAKMYTPTIGSDFVMDYLGDTGLEAMQGADILNAAPQMYSSSVEYVDRRLAFR